jgi:hypothetical protein
MPPLVDVTIFPACTVDMFEFTVVWRCFTCSIQISIATMLAAYTTNTISVPDPEKTPRGCLYVQHTRLKP